MRIRQAALIAAALALAMTLAPVLGAKTACDAFGPRVDCGYVGMTQQECEGRGCCWAPADFGDAPHVDLPWCFKANAGASTYRVVDRTEGEGGSITATLKLDQHTQPELGPDIKELRLDAEPLSDSVLRLKLTDASAPRWEVPTWLFRSELLPGGRARSSGKGAANGAARRLAAAQPKPAVLAAGSGSAGGGAATSSKGRSFELTVREQPFSLEVARPAGASTLHSNGGAVFNTTGTRLVYKDQYLELTTQVPRSTLLFGAGERASETLHLRRNGMPRALWNHDLGPTFLEQNMYSSHPFVLALEEDGSAWGVLLLNSNAMDIVPTQDALSWRVTGGVLDVMLLMGPTPLDVLDQLTQVVGRPAMMPRWAFGWHQCKYGYRSVWEVEEVVANYSKAGLPLEVIWTDIDHMDRWMDFTFHPQNFPLPEMQRFVGELHKKGQRWVPIVDPGIKAEPGYAPYEEGLKEDVFMRGFDGKPYLGWVWPGQTHFPDFFNPAGRDYFGRLLKEHHGLVPWDGIWIDMDEVSNFCTGDVCKPRPAAELEALRDDPPWVCHLDCRSAEDSEINATQRGWLRPPYDVANSLSRLPLGFKAMSVLATHYDGSVQYNTHNLYGLSECLATADAVADATGARPFVLSRSSTTGVGAYAGHWTGDNSASWDQLGQSIPGVLNIGLWGIPFAGADICGFQGDTTPELCARWAALGAFYPFARDHSDLHSGYQELYRWPETMAAGKKALGMRYRLLPYFYTAMHTAHTSGAPIMRPLWMAFPADAGCHTVDRQFMVGPSLLVSPALEQGATSVDAYFPPGVWHSLWGDGKVVDAREGGRREKVEAPLDTVPLHMLGGSALLMHQEAAQTTAQQQRSPLVAVVALPEVAAAGASPSAQGSLSVAGGGQTRISAHMYHDAGEELEVGSSLCHFLTLTATFSHQTDGARSAEVLLQFGSPEHLQQGALVGCAPANDAEAAAAAARAAPGGPLEWPALAGVEVLGWHLPAEGASAEVVQRTDTCGGLAAVERLVLPAAAVGAGPGGLRLDLSSLGHQLECGLGLRITWSAPSTAES